MVGSAFRHLPSLYSLPPKGPYKLVQVSTSNDIYSFSSRKLYSSFISTSINDPH